MSVRSCRLAAAAITLSLSSSALAWGPAVHMREADATLERVAAAGEPWSADAAFPNAAAWLHMGSIAPDFERALDSIPFGHDRALSYHLLEAAPADRPDLRLFALGHLAHNLSDGVESFFCNWAWAQTPIGHIDLLRDSTEDAAGEAELLCETVGDVVLGDWHDVVDVIYDFYADGPTAEEQGRELILWYCVEGAAFYERDVDCDAFVAELFDLIGSAAERLALGDRESAYTLVDSLLGGSPAELLDVLSSGLLDAFAGARGGSTPHRNRDRQRLLASPVLTDAYWDLYEERGFDVLAATWVEATLASRDTGWPRHNLWGYRTANLESMFRYLPERYVAAPGLIVDEVRWLNDGVPIDSVAAHGGQSVTVSVRVYAALPFDGDVTLRVRGDLGGLDAADDPVVATGVVHVDEDPARYVADSRPSLSLDFEPEALNVVGYYVELVAPGETLPWHSTSTDAIWAIEALPMNRRFLRDLFDSYGAFAGSLPVALPESGAGTVIVAAHFAPTEAPVAGVSVQLPEYARSSPTLANGLAIFDNLPARPAVVIVDNPFDDAGPIEQSVTITAGDIAWVDVDVDVAVTFDVPATASSDCIDVTYSLGPVPTREATRVVAWFELEDGTRLTRTNLRNRGSASLCGLDALEDQTEVVVVGHAEFDAIDGLPGRSATILIDRTPPVVADEEPDAGAFDAGADAANDVAEDTSADSPDAVESVDVTPDVSTADIADAVGSDDDVSASRAESSGCAATRGQSSSWALALLLGVVLRRRRRASLRAG